MALSWVIAGGGTGGHVTPALALGEAIAERGDRLVFLGSDRGLEARLIPEEGYDLIALPSRQVLGRGLLGRGLGALGILSSAARAHRALGRVGADLVVSVGGYAAMPAVLAAILRRTPIALVEPNAIPGRVNRLTARFASRIFLCFEAAAARLGDPERARAGTVHCVGVPLRRSLIAKFDSAAPRRKPAPPIRLLVFGGSQGAHQINEAFIEALPRLATFGIEVFHQTGEADRSRVRCAYERAGITAQVVAFEPDMPTRYAWADVAVCRGGMLSLAELTLAGLPAVVVPYPYAADDHQAANAEETARAGAAIALDANTFDGDVLADALLALIEAPERLVQMSAAAAALARPDAAARVVAECARMVGVRQT